jgi:uncharacterized protein
LVNVSGMTNVESFLIAIAAIFLLAGSVSLLAVAMPPGKALAIVIVPAIVTNIWQTFVGPHLLDIVRRLWPLMIGTAAGIWLNAGAMTGQSARYGTILLGILIVTYAVMGLTTFTFHVARAHEKWVGGIVGLVTGVISASSGVQVIPSVPFMQAIGMDKDELVQALGVFFTVATLALGVTLSRSGLLNSATALPGAVAMGCSFAGVFIGQAVRSSLPEEAFRRWFLIALIFLGLYLAGSAIYRPHLA